MFVLVMSPLRDQVTSKHESTISLKEEFKGRENNLRFRFCDSSLFYKSKVSLFYFG